MKERSLKLKCEALASAIDCSADNYIVNSQQDATALNECAAKKSPFNGNVTIGAGASGAIELRDFGIIKGAVVAQDNPALTSLLVQGGNVFDGGIDGSVQHLILRNLSSLTAVSAPTLRLMDGDLAFYNLPSLQNVSLPRLTIVANLHLVGLPKLETFTVDPVSLGSSGALEVVDVGLDSIDALFSAGLHARNVTVDGIDHVNHLEYSLFQSENVTIRGNGDLRVTFDCTGCGGDVNRGRQQTAASLTVSGASSVRRNHTLGGQVDSLVVGSFTATQNVATTLPIDFSNLTSLAIVDNPALVALGYNYNFTDYGWQDILISGNPNLTLKSAGTRGTDWPSPPELGQVWIWPSRNVSSMVFDGPFDNAFL